MARVTNKKQLEECIRQWQASEQMATTEAARQGARNAVKALRSELKTGKPHCTCHNLTLDKCPG